jgi:phosphate transport system substrate-binding protein
LPHLGGRRATVFLIMYKKPKNPERAKVAMDFFSWAMHNGQQLAETLDYVPLPDSLVQQIEAYWKAQFSNGM